MLKCTPRSGVSCRSSCQTSVRGIGEPFFREEAASCSAASWLSLRSALWLESDRMGFLLPTLDEQKLKIQRDVVSNERRQRVENVPYGLSGQRVCDLLYPAPHPYYECVIGVIAEIQAASLDDVRDFFRQYYGPNNASLVLVGDFDPAAAKQLVEKYFGPIPRGPEVKRPDVPQPRI